LPLILQVNLAYRELMKSRLTTKFIDSIKPNPEKRLNFRERSIRASRCASADREKSRSTRAGVSAA
jgi:hypothetical protein